MAHAGVDVLTVPHNVTKKVCTPNNMEAVEALRDAVTCLKPQSKYRLNPGFNPRYLNNKHKNNFFLKKSLICRSFCKMTWTLTFHFAL
jgi:hypothetical protein